MVIVIRYHHGCTHTLCDAKDHTISSQLGAKEILRGLYAKRCMAAKGVILKYGVCNNPVSHKS